MKSSVIKKIFCLSLLICSVFLLTACGESKEDLKNADNAEKYVIDSLEEKYGVEVVVDKVIEYDYKDGDKDDEYNDEYTYYKLHLKDDEEVIFNASTYWLETDEGFFTKKFYFDTNYESFINKKLLEEYFATNKKVKLISELGEQNYNSRIANYEFSLYVDDTDYLVNVPKILMDLQNNIEGLYNCSVNVKSNGKVVSVAIGVKFNQQELSYFEEKINELK